MSVNAPAWRPSLARLAAELAVIVLGVLLALWADGWVAERRDRAVERSRVEALRDNLEATRERLQDAREEAASAREALTLIAYWEDPAEAAERQDVISSGLLFGPAFTPEMNVYDDLKSSGDLALLRNGGLRQALARMDATFEQLALIQADLTMVQQLNFDPFVVREFSLAGALGPILDLDGLPTDAVVPDFDMRVLRNLALFKLDLVTQLLDLYEDAFDVMRQVEEAMGDAGGAGPG